MVVNDSLVLRILVVFILLNVKHVIVGHESVDSAVFVESTRNASSRIHFRVWIEAMVVLVAIIAIRVLIELFEVSNVHIASSN